LLNAFDNNISCLSVFVRANAKFLWKRIPAAIKSVSYSFDNRFSQSLVKKFYSTAKNLISKWKTKERGLI